MLSGGVAVDQMFRQGDIGAGDMEVGKKFKCCEYPVCNISNVLGNNNLVLYNLSRSTDTLLV